MKWVCAHCATLRGLQLPPGVEVSWHMGQCEVCRSHTPVTDMIHFVHHTGAALPADRGAKP